MRRPEDRFIACLDFNGVALRQKLQCSRMISSMTGHASVTNGSISWEIQAINHRNLSIRVDLPPHSKTIDPLCRELLKQKIQRGSINAILRIDPSAEVNSPHLDEEALDRAISIYRQVQERLEDDGHDPIPIPSADSQFLVWLLKFPGVIQQTSQGYDQEYVDTILSTLSDTVEALNQERGREGAELKQRLLEAIAQIETLLQSITEQAGDQIQFIQEKLVQRLGQLEHQADEAAVAREVALMAQRADINEEIERLQIHMEEFCAVLDRAGSHGRRLEFLGQEMSREANTMSSKLRIPDCLNTGIEIKILVDQIREQVLNIE